MVGVTGIEPVTPSMSTKCSPAELYAHEPPHPVARIKHGECGGVKAIRAEFFLLSQSLALPGAGSKAILVFMAPDDPFFLYEPQALGSAVVFSSPHSGREYPDSFIQRSRLSAHALRASEDAFIDRLFREVTGFGAPLIAAKAPRAFVDLNRGPGELDPAVIEGVSAAGLNPRVAAGLGVIPRIVAEGRAIYDGKISLEEANARIGRFHAPYHNMLDSLMNRAFEQFGQAVLIDCHSMPRDALRSVPGVKGGRPEIVLGDRFGSSASRVVMEAVIAAFESAGFRVAVNTPFAGGYITQRYGRPSRNFHAVQVEIDRGLYLDHALMRPGEGYPAFQATLSLVIPELAMIGTAQALAAE